MGTKYTGTNGETEALDAFITLMRASISVSNSLSRSKAFGELTPSQFAVMEALFHLGPMVQKDLASKLLRTSGNLVMVIDNLVGKALVRRTPSQIDRRSMLISLTPKGRGLVRRLFPRHVEIVKESMSALNRSDLRQLRSLCRKLGKGQN